MLLQSTITNEILDSHTIKLYLMIIKSKCIMTVCNIILIIRKHGIMYVITFRILKKVAIHNACIIT